VYRQRPNEVIKVVKWRSNWHRGTLWEPFQASVTVARVSFGIRHARWKGVSLANV